MFDYLSEDEMQYFAGLKTARAKRYEDNCVRNAVGALLNHETTYKLPSGEEVKVTIADKLAFKVVEEALANPNTAKLKDLAHVMGEDKVTVEGNVGEVFLGFVKGNDSKAE